MQIKNKVLTQEEYELQMNKMLEQYTSPDQLKAVAKDMYSDTYFMVPPDVEAASDDMRPNCFMWDAGRGEFGNPPRPLGVWAKYYYLEEYKGDVPDKDLNWQTLENLNKSDFEESEHPRDKDGKFTDKGTGYGVSAANFKLPKYRNIKELYREKRGVNNVKYSKTAASMINLPRHEIDEMEAMLKSKESIRASVKKSLVLTLSSKSGVPEDKVSDIIKQWSNTSNGHSASSQKIQRVVSEMFHVELSDWQKQNIKEVEDARQSQTPEGKAAYKQSYERRFYKRAEDIIAAAKEYKKERPTADAASCIEAAYYRGSNFDVIIPEDDPFIRYGSLSKWFEYTTNIYKALRDSNGDINSIKPIVENMKQFIDDVVLDFNGGPELDETDVKKVVSAMYENTQEQFAKMGFNPDDEIEVYRGLGHNLVEGRKGEIVEVHGNAIESWSLYPKVAQKFGKFVLASRVPVKNILSTFMSGFGCLNESELVVLNGTKSTAVILLST